MNEDLDKEEFDSKGAEKLLPYKPIIIRVQFGCLHSHDDINVLFCSDQNFM